MYSWHHTDEPYGWPVLWRVLMFACAYVALIVALGFITLGWGKQAAKKFMGLINSR